MSDIIIVGGGLAGLNTARTILETSDFRVVLVDKGRSPKNNPLRLTFSETVKKWEIDDCIRAGYDAFGILSYHGASLLHRFDSERFVALDYRKACEKYLSILTDHHRFQFISDRAIGLGITDDVVRIEFKNHHPVEGKLLIDASGKSHFSINLTGKSLPKLYSHSFGESFINCENKKLNEAWFIGASADYGSGGGWYYPTGESTASVGFAVITGSPTFPAKILREKYYRAINEVEPVNQWLVNAKAIHLEAGTIPIQYHLPFSENRLLVVGDAAGQATPWMCMGVEPVLLNSSKAAHVAVKALNNGDCSAGFLSEFDLLWKVANLEQFQTIEDMHPKIWFGGEAVWDFIIEKDLAKLTPEQFYERIRYNNHLMSKWTSLVRWGLFRFEHLKDWKKYKDIKS